MRFERKYRVDNLSMHHIMQIIRSHPASFYKLYPNRTVNNIYFDTPNMTCLNDNLMGINIRKKYRVRWYGDDINTINSPNLEIKFKENELGGKTIFPVEPFLLSNIKDIQQQVNTMIPQLYTLQPTLLNSYSRSYWGTKDLKFRITIDTDLRFHSLIHSRNFFKYVTSDKVVIVELKYEKDDEKAIKRITSFLPFRLSKNSKYVNGIMITQ
jgi:hypothetical protein